MEKNENQYIILFDGVCNLCDSVVQFIIKRDPLHRFRFASLQSETGQRLSGELGLPSVHFDTFVYIGPEGYFLRSDAALYASKMLSGPWKLLYFLIVVPKPWRDAAYRYISKNRYAFFGKKDSCTLPEQGTRSLFLP